MMKNEGIYASIITVLVLLAFIIPYTLLSNIEKWGGSFLFWTVLTVLVIGVNYSFMKNWGKEK